MTVSECIKSRRSIREFTSEKVSHETLDEIISVAAYAPSWKNTQITRYVCIEGALKDEIAATCFDSFPGNGTIVSKAAALIAVTFIKNRSGFERDGSYSTNKEDRWQNFDTGLATEAFCLAAHDKNVGSVILGYFDEAKISKAINLPDNLGLSVLIAIGYHDITPDAPKRKEVSELISYLS